MKIFYICDRKRCENCYDECRHTSDASHAAHFKELKDYDPSWADCERSNDLWEFGEPEQNVQGKLNDVIAWVNESPNRRLKIETAPTGFILGAKLEVKY